MNKRSEGLIDSLRHPFASLWATLAVIALLAVLLLGVLFALGIFAGRDIITVVSGGAMGAILGTLMNYGIQEKRNKDARKSEAEQAKARRAKILKALRAQIGSLLEISEHNKTATQTIPPPTHVVPLTYPLKPFEIAIFSENGISVADATEEATRQYLLKARELNILMDILNSSHLEIDSAGYLGSRKNQIRGFIYDQTIKDMSNILVSLREVIESELRQ